jgi:signal transduction histidine kinase
VLSARSIGLTISVSVAATVALVVGLFWFVTQYHELLPVTFVDVHPLSLFRKIIGGLVVLTLGGIALYLLWVRRRTLLDEWLVVALSALLIEIALASVLSGDRYTVSWYAGRFYQLVTATVVMVVLLAEMTKLYAHLARSNASLQQERLLLERAVQAQRREREARLMTGDAVAAAIAHEIKQPLATMVFESASLSRSDPDEGYAPMIDVARRYPHLISRRSLNRFEASVYRGWASAHLKRGCAHAAWRPAWRRLCRQPLSAEAWWIIGKCAALACAGSGRRSSVADSGVFCPTDVSESLSWCSRRARTSWESEAYEDRNLSSR